MEAIFIAIRRQDVDAVKAYLASGQSVAIKNSEGQSPLQLAIAVGNPKIIELLIAQKANFCAVDVPKPGEDSRH